MHEDDDYYDDDEYEEYEDEDSSRGLLIALVIVLIFGVLAVFVAISVLVTIQTGGFDKLFAKNEPTATEATSAESAPEKTVDAKTEADSPGDPWSGFRSPGEDAPDGAGTEAAAELDSGDGESGSGGAGLEAGSAAAATDSSRSFNTLDDEYEEPTPARRTQASRSTRSASSDSRRSSGRSSSSGADRASARSSSSSGGSSRRATVRSSPSRSSGRSQSSAKSQDVARILDDDDDLAQEWQRDAGSGAGRGAASRGPTMSYDKQAIAALASKASGGALTDTQTRALQGVPVDHPNYTLAWATVMKNAESKKNYKGHCEAAAKVMKLPRNKYHPEWNLEQAKCQLRNGRYLDSVKSIDRTLGDSFGMSAATKTRRLLLAYEIKAQSRTRIYDDHAKANSGLSDKNKLNSAIQAWMEYRNYASGIGDQKALQKANREVADLEERKGR